MLANSENFLHTHSDDHIELHSISHVDVLKEPEEDETHTWLEDGFGLCAMHLCSVAFALT